MVRLETITARSLAVLIASTLFNIATLAHPTMSDLSWQDLVPLVAREADLGTRDLLPPRGLLQGRMVPTRGRSSSRASRTGSRSNSVDPQTGRPQLVPEENPVPGGASAHVIAPPEGAQHRQPQQATGLLQQAGATSKKTLKGFANIAVAAGRFSGKTLAKTTDGMVAKPADAMSDAVTLAGASAAAVGVASVDKNIAAAGGAATFIAKQNKYANEAQKERKKNDLPVQQPGEPTIEAGKQGIKNIAAAFRGQNRTPSPDLEQGRRNSKRRRALVDRSLYEKL